MKKLTLATLVGALSLVATSAFANFQGPATGAQGFNGPSVAPANTVKAVLDTGFDEMHVTLTGKVSQALGGEMYMFTDGTGSIQIEVDHEDWRGITVTPQTKVTIYGEVDYDYGTKKIDIDHIRLS